MRIWFILTWWILDTLPRWQAIDYIYIYIYYNIHRAYAIIIHDVYISIYGQQPSQNLIAKVHRARDATFSWCIPYDFAIGTSSHGWASIFACFWAMIN